MAEWNENKLEQELDMIMQDMPETEDLEKRIIKGINQRVRKIVVRTVAVILVCLLAVFLVISPLMNLVFFNPEKLNREPELTMLDVMEDYVETTMPYRDVWNLQVKNCGFGRYEIEMQVMDLTGPLNAGPINVWCEMNWGQYENIKNPDGSFAQVLGRFECGWENQEEMIKKIKELPQSSMLYLSVSGSEPKTLEKLENLPAKLAWIQIYQPNVEFQGGFDMMQTSISEEELEKLRKDMTEKEILETYISNLENLLANKEVWGQFGLHDGKSKIYSADSGVLKETFDDAKTLKEIQVENYCVYGKRDEIVQFLEENTLDSIYVERVSLWRMD